MDFTLKILKLFKKSRFHSKNPVPVHVQHSAKRRQVNSRWRDACHAFALRVGKNLENTIDTASNVVLKGRPLHNHHLKILKGLKLLLTLSKKKEKKYMVFLNKKDSEFQWHCHLSQDI